jgi:hypothetical protein
MRAFVAGFERKRSYELLNNVFLKIWLKWPMDAAMCCSNSNYSKYDDFYLLNGSDPAAFGYEPNPNRLSYNVLI